MSDYSKIVKLVNDLYNSYNTDINLDPAARASDSALSDCGINNVINNVSTFSSITSMNGSIRGYQYLTSIPSNNTEVDSDPSNFDSTSSHPFPEASGGGGWSRGGGAGRYPGGWGKGGVRGNNTVSIPVTKTSPFSSIANALHSGVEFIENGVATVKHAIGNVVGSAWAGIGALAKFGFDAATNFYKSEPDVWEKIVKDGKSTYPDDYASIFNEDQNGRTLINGMYVVDSSGNVTYYIPEDVLAFFYRQLRDNGYLPTDEIYEIPANQIPVGNWGNPISVKYNIDGNVVDPNGNTTREIVGFSYSSGFVMGINTGTWTQDIGYATLIKDAICTMQYINKSTNPNTNVSSIEYIASYRMSYGNYVGYRAGPRPFSSGGNFIGNTFIYPNDYDILRILYGRKTAGGYNGINQNSSSTQIDPSIVNGTTIPQIVQQFSANYPQVFGSPITMSFMDDSCNEININYHPVSIPITIGVGDIFPVSIDSLVNINPSFNPQTNPTLNPDFNINRNFEIEPDFNNGGGIPSISIDPSVSISPDISLPDINIDNLLDHIFDIIAENMQGAPGGGGISLDPNINITINNYNDQVGPYKPDLPQINVNPPTVNVNVNVDGGSGLDYPPTVVEMPNTSLPDPTFPVIIPPWPVSATSSPPSSEPEGWPTAMWHVYNPTQAQINAFGAWLWSPDFVDTIKRMFESPIDSVFTLHKVYCLPNTSGSDNIVVGSLNSGVPSRVVSSQYTNIDCGEIQLDEFFGNVFDYAPYTVLNMYLPFIGIVELDPAYCMRSTISVYYTVDVFTGACVAKIGCKRDGVDVCVYEYSGSASLDYPVSAGSYSSIMQGVLSGALSAIAGGVGSYLTGNPMPAVYGASSAIHQSLSGRAEIRHSGSFAGAAGAMGIRKPYLIISRPIIALAEDFAHFDGYPANETVYVSECKGYIKCKECHLNIPTAYQSELDEIDNYFKTGVII